jgi:hypothetical protein
MWAALLIAAGIAALLFRNLLPDITTHLYSDLGDPLLNAAILAWNAREWPLTEAWWNFPSYAPLTGVTAFTEHLLLTYPVASPIVWLTGNAVLAHNVVFLAAMPLNAVAAFALARELLRTGGVPLPPYGVSHHDSVASGSSRKSVESGASGSSRMSVDSVASGSSRKSVDSVASGSSRMSVESVASGSSRRMSVESVASGFSRKSVEPKLVHAAALVAGLAYAFAPYQQVHLSHLQHMTSFGLPVALLGLHRYLHTGRRRPLLVFAAGWFAAALANSALLVFVPLAVAAWCVWCVRPREWRRLVAPAVAALLATLPLVPLLLGYRARQAEYGFTREYNEIQGFSADLVGLAGMYHRALPWRGVLPHDFEEGALFPGFITLALALGAIAMAVRSALPGLRSPWSRRLLWTFVLLTLIVLARVWTGPWSWHIGPLPLPSFRPYRLFTIAALALLGAVLLSAAFRRAWAERDLVIGLATLVVCFWLTTLGPEPEWSTPWRALVWGPYRLLMEMPGVTSIRVPARAWFPALLGLAMLAGFGTAALLARLPRHGRVVALALAIGIVTEGSFFDGTMEAPRPTRRGAIPEGAIVLDLPWDEGYQNAVPQYRAVVGGYRTLNGYSGYQPAHVYPLRRAIADLVPDALDAYRRRGDLYVIVRADVAPLIERFVASRPAAEHRFTLEDGARVYRLPRLRDAGADLLR